MFGRKKYPVLTETTCAKIDILRVVLEVISGQIVKFINLDLNTGNGTVKVGSTVFDLHFRFTSEDTLSFSLGRGEYMASFMSQRVSGEKIIHAACTNDLDGKRIEYEGVSAIDRVRRSI